MAEKKRGGGPKTAKGKAVVRLNPLRHGVLSQTPVIPLIEKWEDWERLRLGIHEFFGVTGLVWPEALADRLAATYWRLLRNMRLETESITAYLADVPRDWRSLREAVGLPVPEELTPEAIREMDEMLMTRLLPGDEMMDKVLRYETKHHRMLLQTEHQLMVVMQMYRSGQFKRGPGLQLGTPDLTPPAMPAEGVRRPRVLVKAHERGKALVVTHRGDGAGRDAGRHRPRSLQDDTLVVTHRGDGAGRDAGRHPARSLQDDMSVEGECGAEEGTVSEATGVLREGAGG